MKVIAYHFLIWWVSKPCRGSQELWSCLWGATHLYTRWERLLTPNETQACLWNARTTLPAWCRSFAEQAAPRILQHACPLLVNWMVEDRCWSVSRGQIVCPKEKSSVYSRPKPSLCFLDMSLVTAADWWQSQTGTVSGQRWAGSRSVQGRYQARIKAPQPQSKQQGLEFGIRVSNKHSPGAARALQGDKWLASRMWARAQNREPREQGEIWAEFSHGRLSGSPGPPPPPPPTQS